MSVQEVEIYQVGQVPDKCFKWDASAGGGAGAFLDQSTDAFSYGGTAQTLWEDNNDVIYVGKATVARSDTLRGWCILGYKAHTAPVGYGTFSFEYSADYDITAVAQGDKKFSIAEDIASALEAGDSIWIEGSAGGANDGKYTIASVSGTTDIVVDEAIPDPTETGAISWITLDVKHEGTSGFTQDGWIMWTLPGPWTLRDVNSVTRYWIRAYQSEAAPGTAAKYTSLLENVTLGAPVKLHPSDSREKIVADINQITRKTDLPNYSCNALNIAVGRMSLGALLANLNLILIWETYGLKLDVYDMAYSSDPTPSTDSLIKKYRGRIVAVDPNIKAVWKQDPDDTWSIKMMIEDTDTLVTLAGG